MLGFLRVLLVVVVTVGVASVSVVAEAQKASQKDKNQAKKYFLEGKSQQDAGNYGQAAKNYKQAYELFPIPILLFNLGQVYRLDGKKRLALDYYQRYLEAEPKGQGSALARDFVVQLKADIEKEEQAERERQAREAEEGKNLPDQDPQDGEGEGDEIFDDGSQPGRDDGGTDSGKALKWSGIGVAAAGAVALGFGIKFGIDAKNISDELSDNRDPWTEELLDKQDEGESAETKMFIFTAAGAAAIIGGGVLYYFGHRSSAESQERMTVAPVIGGDNVGFALTGRF